MLITAPLQPEQVRAAGAPVRQRLQRLCWPALWPLQQKHFVCTEHRVDMSRNHIFCSHHQESLEGKSRRKKDDLLGVQPAQGQGFA